MELFDGFVYFSTVDFAALACLVIAWMGVAIWIENSGHKNPSVSVLMREYRKEWMKNHLTRDPRVFDMIMMTGLQQGAIFFASGSMLALGALLALIGNTEPILEVASDLSIALGSAVVLEVKLMVMIVILTNAFLKFVWSVRLYGYTSIMMGAIPNDLADPACEVRASRAADLANTAARHFTRGLRSMYFTIAALAWLISAWALIGAVLFTLGIIWRREFASETKRIIGPGTDL